MHHFPSSVQIRRVSQRRSRFHERMLSRSKLWAQEHHSLVHLWTPVVLSFVLLIWKHPESSRIDPLTFTPVYMWLFHLWSKPAALRVSRKAGKAFFSCALWNKNIVYFSNCQEKFCFCSDQKNTKWEFYTWKSLQREHYGKNQLKFQHRKLGILKDSKNKETVFHMLKLQKKARCRGEDTKGSFGKWKYRGAKFLNIMNVLRLFPIHLSNASSYFWHSSVVPKREALKKQSLKGKRKKE